MTLHLAHGFEAPGETSGGNSALDYGFDNDFGARATATGYFGSDFWDGGLLNYTLPTTDTHSFVGFAMSVDATGRVLWEMSDGATVQLQLKSITSGTGYKVELYRGAATTLLATTTTELTFNTFYYFELDAVFHASTGTATVYVDANPEITLTATNTAPSGNNRVTKITNIGAGIIKIDAFYICNDQGTSHNSRLGPQTTTYLTASAEGTDTSGTANTGTKPAAVDDADEADGDTTYVSLSSAGTRQGFTKAAMPDAGLGVPNVDLVWRGRRDDAGPTTARGYIRNASGTYAYGTTRTLAATYTTYRDSFPLSPFTSLAWTQTEVDGCEFGVEKVS